MHIVSKCYQYPHLLHHRLGINLKLLPRNVSPIFWIITCLYCNIRNYLDLFIYLLFSAAFHWSLTSKCQKPEDLIFSITKKRLWNPKNTFYYFGNQLELYSSYLIRKIKCGRVPIIRTTWVSYPFLNFTAIRSTTFHLALEGGLYILPLLISKMRIIFVLTLLWY